MDLSVVGSAPHHDYRLIIQPTSAAMHADARYARREAVIDPRPDGPLLPEMGDKDVSGAANEVDDFLRRRALGQRATIPSQPR